MSEYTINAIELESHSDKAEQLARMALALEVAMFAGGFNPLEFQPAISLFTDLMTDHARDMRALYNAAKTDNKGAHNMTALEDKAPP